MTLNEKAEVTIGRVTSTGKDADFVRVRIALRGGGMVDADLDLAEFAKVITGQSVTADAVVRGLVRPMMPPTEG